MNMINKSFKTNKKSPYKKAMQKSTRPPTKPIPISTILPPPFLDGVAPSPSAAGELGALAEGFVPGGEEAPSGAGASSSNNNTLSTTYTARGKSFLKALLICVSTTPVDTFTWLALPVKFKPKLPWLLPACVGTGLLTVTRSSML
ncbi:hypothetical protein Hanom_Chr16g01459401 [Helianthus anomalus]